MIDWPREWLPLAVNGGKALAEQSPRCPICRKRTDPRAQVYPFCSERCKTIDLGNWASENYVTHSPLTEADEKNDPSERIPENE